MESKTYKQSKVKQNISIRALTCPTKVITIARMFAAAYNRPSATSSDTGYAHSTLLTIVAGIVGSSVTPNSAAEVSSTE